MNIAAAFASIELHVLDVDRELPTAFGKAIKAAGGRFSELRSCHDSKRFVHIPTEALQLVQSISSRFTIQCVIFRGPTQAFADRTVLPAERGYSSGKEPILCGKQGQASIFRNRDDILTFLESLLSHASTPEALERQKVNETARMNAVIAATKDRLARERQNRVAAQAEEMADILGALMNHLRTSAGELGNLVQRSEAVLTAVKTPGEGELPLDAVEQLS